MLFLKLYEGYMDFFLFSVTYINIVYVYSIMKY